MLDGVAGALDVVGEVVASADVGFVQAKGRGCDGLCDEGVSAAASGVFGGDGVESPSTGVPLCTEASANAAISEVALAASALATAQANLASAMMPSLTALSAVSIAMYCLVSKNW